MVANYRRQKSTGQHRGGSLGFGGLCFDGTNDPANVSQGGYFALFVCFFTV